MLFCAIFSLKNRKKNHRPEKREKMARHKKHLYDQGVALTIYFDRLILKGTFGGCPFSMNEPTWIEGRHERTH